MLKAPTLALLLVVCGGCADAQIIGRASVIDGDTLEVQGQRIRLWGVDAPESRQSCTRAGQAYRCGQDAANALDRYIASRPVVCVQQDVDRYHRIVASCSVDRTDLGGWLVREGLAVRYAEYAGAAYVVEEVAARAAHRGVWAGEFDLPKDWRRNRRR